MPETVSKDDAERQSKFDEYIVDGTPYDISHLENISFTIALEGNRPVTVNVSPTNHLYSRAVKKHVDDIGQIQQDHITTGRWLKSCSHTQGNFQDVIIAKDGNPTFLESRVFCYKKYLDNKNLAACISEIASNPKQVRVSQPNVNDLKQGDHKTCLSLSMPINQEQHYLMFYELLKHDSNNLHLIVKTGYVANTTNRAVKKHSETPKSDRKQFVSIANNVYENRLPFVGKKNNKKRKVNKTKKNK